MKKAVLITLLLMVGTFLLAPAPRRTAIVVDEPVDFTQSVVRLVNENRTFCSGTVVAPNVIVTAAHCLITTDEVGNQQINPNPIEIRTKNNRPLGVWARAVMVSPQMDQGLITGDFKKFVPRKFQSDVKSLIDQRLHNTNYISCGYPLGGSLVCTELKYLRMHNFMWAVDGILIPGMSGGPVMRPDGTVVAVNVAVSDEVAIISPIYNIDMKP